MGKITPIAASSVLKGAASKIKDAERSTLLQLYEQYKQMRHETIRRLVVDQNRIDILATVVLGYEIQPFHLAMLKWQFLHPDNLQLVFRGAGKSTVCTITKTIHMLCKDRNLRVLIASKTKGNAEGFLKEIKAHLEGNAKLIEIFGEFYDPHRVSKWDNSEIEVVGRTLVAKEASITTVGFESAVVSRHYDVIISDDLVDEDNARTQHMRDKLKSWNYQVLDPTLMPPDQKRAHVGEHHRQGTRYHFADLYGHFIDGSPDGTGGELRDHTQIIRALDERGRSPWPEKYPPQWFQEKKLKSGTIIFNSQYQNDTEAMKGEIFQYDHCVQVSAEEWPDEQSLKVFIGIDLAIKESEKSDQFAIVVIGCEGKIMAGNKSDFTVHVLDYYAGHLRFAAQTDKILSFYDRFDPIQAGIEVNAYQLAQYQMLKDRRPRSRFLPITTDKDKVTRAWKLSALFEQQRVRFKKGVHGPLIDQLVLFPNHEYKDLFDALDLAVAAAKRRGGRRERREPGLL